MPDETRLREQARAAVQNRKISARPADRTWGGPGVGAECVIREKPVTKDEMEFEIEFAHDGKNPGVDPPLHLYVRCFAAWEFERNKPPQ
jgi:hypothetical protein